MMAKNRHWYATCFYLVFMVATFYYDPLLAIEACFLSLWGAMMIKYSVKNWKSSKRLFVKCFHVVFGLVMLSIMGLLILGLYSPISSLLVVNTSKQQVSDHLRSLVKGMQYYEEKHGTMPMVASYSTKQEPLLSWRVHLLPFLGMQNLYERFHLDEPWDSPHNITLLPLMPDFYQLPRYARQAQSGYTYIQLIVGKGAFFEEKQQRSLAELAIKDGKENTIVAGIAMDAVPWTKPADIVWTDPQPPGLGCVFQYMPSPFGRLINGLNSDWSNRLDTPVVFADGHVARLNWIGQLGKLKPFITWNGGEKVEWESICEH